MMFCGCLPAYFAISCLLNYPIAIEINDKKITGRKPGYKFN